MSDIERALHIAVKAHANQKDKNGAPYIMHPLRVMMRCHSENAKIVALLHDVVEDTPVTFDVLVGQGFGPEILKALRLLTHDNVSSYDEYIAHIMEDPLAMEVKIADLEDNSDIRRLSDVDEAAVKRLRKYHRAHRQLVAKRDA